MPELRKDPIVKRWVVIAPDRAKRPIELVEEASSDDSSTDPFAEGNEKETPGEILALREVKSDVDGPGWRVRVIPNKFPALLAEGDSDIRREGLYESMNGYGTHEVIVECPQFETSMSRLSVANIGQVLTVYRDRLLELKQDPRVVHASIFKNSGLMAGLRLAIRIRN